jgi:hypothetical protein
LQHLPPSVSFPETAPVPARPCPAAPPVGPARPAAPAPQGVAWAVPLAALALVLVLYGDALGYAFMYDDGIDLARGEQRSVLSLLTAAEGAFYYRPLPFLFWKGLHALLGQYDTFWFHLPLLLLHALNGWLVYLLARGLGLRWTTALLASGLFVIFPLHYQVVPWAGALFHPLVTALVLGALLAYRRARGGPHAARWLGVSVACTAVGLFTHEYAVTVGVLVAGLELWLWRRGLVRRWRPYALIYLALAAAYSLWWLAVPKWPRTFALDPESLWRNGLMIAQAALWPLASAWRWAPPWLLAHPEAAAAVGALGALALAAWVYHRGRTVDLLVHALGWVGVTMLPAWLTLSWLYVEDGARLYYLASVGAALGWAGLAELAGGTGWARRRGQALVLALVVWSAWQSADFLITRRAMYAEGTALLHQAGALAAAAPADARLLFINLPSWRAPATPAFPLGNTGVTFIPEYVLLGQALYVNGGAVAQLDSLATLDVPGGWPAHYGPHGAWATGEEVAAAARQATAAYITRFGPNGAWLEPWGAAP